MPHEWDNDELRSLLWFVAGTLMVERMYELFQQRKAAEQERYDREFREIVEHA